MFAHKTDVKMLWLGKNLSWPKYPNWILSKFNVIVLADKRWIVNLPCISASNK